MNNLTVEKLRRNKFKVRVLHKRLINLNKLLILDARNAQNEKIKIKNGDLIPLYEIRLNKLQDYINPHGGETLIQILTPDNKEYNVGAKCSKHDSFDRKRAINIALGRFQKILDNPLVFES